MAPRYVGTAVIARILGVSDRSVRRWCEDGLIPPAHYTLTPGGHYRITLVDSGTLILWLRENRTYRNAERETA